MYAPCTALPLYMYPALPVPRVNSSAMTPSLGQRVPFTEWRCVPQWAVTEGSTRQKGWGSAADEELRFEQPRKLFAAVDIMASGGYKRLRKQVESTLQHIREWGGGGAPRCS